MSYLNAVGEIAQRGIECIITNNPYGSKGRGNTSVAIMRSCQEQILFNQIFPANINIAWKFSGNENPFAVTQCTGGFILDTVTSDECIKERKCIPILYYFIILAYNS